jgi:hypothetical protein
MATADVPDEVPLADAVEQNRETVERPPDDEAPELPADGVPLEAPGSDWHEQSQIVDIDVDLDGDVDLEETDPRS